MVPLCTLTAVRFTHLETMGPDQSRILGPGSLAPRTPCSTTFLIPLLLQLLLFLPSHALSLTLPGSTNMRGNACNLDTVLVVRNVSRKLGVTRAGFPTCCYSLHLRSPQPLVFDSVGPILSTCAFYLLGAPCSVHYCFLQICRICRSSSWSTTASCKEAGPVPHPHPHQGNKF